MFGPGRDHATRLDDDLPPAGEEELELMVQASGWAKYGSTEWVSFVLIFAVATVGLFLGRLSAELWLIAALGSAVITGAVRTAKHLKILGLEFEGYKCRCEEEEPPK